MNHLHDNAHPSVESKNHDLDSTLTSVAVPIQPVERPVSTLIGSLPELTSFIVSLIVLITIVKQR